MGLKARERIKTSHTDHIIQWRVGHSQQIWYRRSYRQMITLPPGHGVYQPSTVSHKLTVCHE
jgi:hypothetical protein